MESNSDQMVLNPSLQRRNMKMVVLAVLKKKERKKNKMKNNSKYGTGHCQGLKTDCHSLLYGVTSDM